MARLEQELMSSRCTLCPAGCEIGIVPTGPDMWRTEYPPSDGGGLCPRGSALGELLGHRLRILEPYRRVPGPGQPRGMDLSATWNEILACAGNDRIMFLLDGNIPCEELVEAADWCGAWDNAGICFVTEPAEEQLLLGIEATQADYLSNESLAQCDGFVIIGDAFGANPTCARSVLDRKKEEDRTPIVAIDPAAGIGVKFATHCVRTSPGKELQALIALAGAAGIDVPWKSKNNLASANAAGKAIAQCKRLGVLIAAEYGRSSQWRQIGYVAGKLAGALGGGVAPQTTGANALAAVRLGKELGAVTLAEALSANAPCVAIGCDVLGMLAWENARILAAAASLPNATTDVAEIVLPVAMAGEMGGTYFFRGDQSTKIAPLMSPPAGVPGPAQIVKALAKAAGVTTPSPRAQLPKRVKLPEPAEAPSLADPDPARLVLLLSRTAAYAGCGALTAHSSWQNASRPAPELRISPQDAREINAKNLDIVTVSACGKRIEVCLRVSPELSAGTVVLPEGLAQTRQLAPCTVEADGAGIVAAMQTVDLSPTNVQTVTNDIG